MRERQSVSKLSNRTRSDEKEEEGKGDRRRAHRRKEKYIYMKLKHYMYIHYKCIDKVICLASTTLYYVQYYQHNVLTLVPSIH